MAQARMLRKEICESDSFAELNSSDAQLLLCLLTPWWSDHGKMIGEPVWIKGNIVRKLRQYTEKRIIWCLGRINSTTDVHFWTDEKGNRWLYWPKFDVHQSISKEKKSKDLYPSPKFPKIPQKNPPIREVKLSKEEEKGPVAPPLSDLDFIKELKNNPAYNHINIDIELNKMDAWLLLPKNKGRKKTRRFILSWLNRVEAPVNLKPEARPQTRKDHEKEQARDPGVKDLIHKTALELTKKGMK